MIVGGKLPAKVGRCEGYYFTSKEVRNTKYLLTSIHGIHAGVAQLVEHHLAKVNVASSNLVSRSINITITCHRLADLVSVFFCSGENVF